MAVASILVMVISLKGVKEETKSGRETVPFVNAFQNTGPVGAVPRGT